MNFKQNWLFKISFGFLLLVGETIDASCQTIIARDSPKKYYNLDGVIFPAEYAINFGIHLNRYTPSIAEVVKAETIFLNKFNETLSSDPRVLGFRPVKNISKKFKNHVRQYLGFYDSLQNHFILAQMLNFDNSKNVNEVFFKSYQSKFITGIGGFYESNTSRYLINIDKKEMKLY